MAAGLPVPPTAVMTLRAGLSDAGAPTESAKSQDGNAGFYFLLLVTYYKKETKLGKHWWVYKQMKGTEKAQKCGACKC